MPWPARSRARNALGLFRFFVPRFLAALVLLFVAGPFLDQFKHGKVVEAALMTLVLCMGVLAIGARRKTLLWAIILVLPAVLGNWAHHFWPEHWPAEAVTAARLVFVAFVVARLLVFILRAPRVNSEVLCAGISIYLLLGLLWTFAYTAVARLTPNAFAFSVPPAPAMRWPGSLPFTSASSRSRLSATVTSPGSKSRACWRCSSPCWHPLRRRAHCSPRVALLHLRPSPARQRARPGAGAPAPAGSTGEYHDRNRMNAGDAIPPAELEERLQFEILLTELLARFVNIPDEQGGRGD